MKINRGQRFALLGGAVLATAAVLFPPLHIVGEGGRVVTHSIGFLFGSYEYGTHLAVNTALLVVELAGIALATACAFLGLSSIDK